LSSISLYSITSSFTYKTFADRNKRGPGWKQPELQKYLRHSSTHWFSNKVAHHSYREYQDSWQLLLFWDVILSNNNRHYLCFF
jgi:hypothetical protein